MANNQQLTVEEVLKKYKVMKVRLTTYWRIGSGTDKWTRAGKTSTGAPLVNKRTAAVDPKLISYGKEIILPDVNLKLIAHDTGGAVKSRTASRKTGRNEPVIDVFFDHKEDAIAFSNSMPLVVDALIER